MKGAPDDLKPLIKPAAWPWRLPVVRHVRAIVLSFRVATWQDLWSSAGYVPSDFDQRVLRQIWRGIV